jgi:hypothetical protein
MIHPRIQYRACDTVGMVSYDWKKSRSGPQLPSQVVLTTSLGRKALVSPGTLRSWRVLNSRGRLFISEDDFAWRNGLSLYKEWEIIRERCRSCAEFPGRLVESYCTAPLDT